MESKARFVPWLTCKKTLFATQKNLGQRGGDPSYIPSHLGIIQATRMSMKVSKWIITDYF